MANIRKVARIKGLMLSLSFFLMMPSAIYAQFDYTTNFTYVTNGQAITTNGTITVTGYDGPGGIVIIPSITNGYPVTAIGNDAFAYNTSLTNIIVPDSVRSIGFASLDGCTSLTNIIIGNSVTDIVEFPFYDCPSLAGVYFRGNAPTLHLGVLPGKQLTIYHLPNTSGWNAFANEAFAPIALWLPAIQTGDLNFGIQTNQFGFNVSWASGQTVVVDACTNLLNIVWQPLQTNMLTNCTVYFGDQQWTNYPTRYYRISSQ